jgi:Amt family ammonium transporter
MKKGKMKSLAGVFIIALIALLPFSVFAEDAASAIDTGDTAFIFISTVLVFIMTPGLAFFYGGMVRKKNVLNTMMNSFTIIAIVSIQWVLIGYTIAFGPDVSHLFGNFDWIGLKGIGMAPNADYAGTIPQSLFVLFQMMFAIITPALITGSFAERMRFPAFLIFILLWSTLVYDPLAHWVWGVGGWLRNMGALDFAGGTVVHISSGIAGLTAALVLGKRKGYRVTPMIPHNIPFVVLGAGLLWFGWFGFNGGSALAANGLAMGAFLVTNTAAAAAALSWIFVEWIRQGKPTMLGAATGAIVGLVAITPAAGFVGILPAIIIGLVVSPLCYFMISVVKSKLGYDDSLDAFGCHGIGGIWGALATGLFASKEINPLGNDGLFFGNPSQLGVQALSVVVTIVFSAVMTFIILKVISLFTKLRASDIEEEEGLDTTLHGEDAYPDFSGADLDGELKGFIKERNNDDMVVTKNKPAAVSINEAVPVEVIHRPADENDDKVKMTKIEIITKHSKFEALKAAMNEIGVSGMTVTQVMGCGIQKGMPEYYRGVVVEMNLLPKVQVEIVVSKIPVRTVIETAKKALYSGHIGDGKIFVYNVENVIRVRTGEEGFDALQDD